MRKRKNTPYWRRLNAVIDEIFHTLYAREISMLEIVRRSGLCPKTILNLETRKTFFPRFKTVFELARVAGYEVQLSLVQSLRKTA